MAKKRAIIAGVTGQDGSYLCELLTEKGYDVIGLTRQVSCQLPLHLSHLSEKAVIQYCSYSEQAIADVISKFAPNEIYNLTGQTYVSKSWEMIPETVSSTGLIPINFIQAINKTDKKIRFFHASSSELYFPEPGVGIHEGSKIEPSTPYGCSKAFAHHMISAYRKYYGLYLVNGILFNHESSRRNDDFLSKKVVRAAVAIKRGHQKELRLGNLQVARDWGYAPDFVDAMFRSMQLENPMDFVISTGEVHSVEELVRTVFEHVGLDWREYVHTDPALLRKSEPLSVLGSNQRIRELTGWKPKTSFSQMLKIMVESELNRQEER